MSKIFSSIRLPPLPPFPHEAFGAALTSQAGSFVSAAAGAIQNPDKGDMVARVGEISANLTGSLQGMQKSMMGTRAGRSILMHQPRIADDTLFKAREMKEGTFGNVYAQFMDANEFLPSGRPPVENITDPFEAYVMTRYRECHDFLHSVLLCGRSVEEEIAVKMVEFHHTGLPIGALAVIGGMPHLSQDAVKRVLGQHRDWARRNAPKDHLHLPPNGEPATRNFLCVPWEDMLALPHEEVLVRVGMVPFAGPRTFP